MFLVTPAFAASGYTWAQKLDAGPINQTFVGIASSASGKYLSSVSTDGEIYTSQDFGDNWTDATNGTTASGQIWRSVSMSANGRYQTALVPNGDIWHSQDYGATWTNVTTGTAPSGSNWLQSATSSTGQYVVASNYTDIYESSDYGEHWTKKTTAGLSGRPWNYLAMSATGQYIYAVEDGIAIYRSSNYGTDWTKLVDKPSPATSGWNVITTSADGKRVVAGDFQGDLYRSNDFGANWEDVTDGTPASNQYWNGLSSSATGQYIVAMANNNSGTDPTPVYVSRDYGITWTNTTGGTTLETTYWMSIAMSASGQRIAGAASGQGIYAADDPSLRPPAPVITNQNIETTISSGENVTVNVLSGATSYDADTLSILSGPSHGTAVDEPGGITYTAFKDFLGTDSLIYQLCAPLDDTVCSQATLTFHVIVGPATGFGQPGNSNGIFVLIAFGSLLVTGLGLLAWQTVGLPKVGAIVKRKSH